jgi:hypothetical protein
MGNNKTPTIKIWQMIKGKECIHVTNQFYLIIYILYIRIYKIELYDINALMQTGGAISSPVGKNGIISFETDIVNILSLSLIVKL